MKKTSKSTTDIRPDYDFSKGIHGKYVKNAALDIKESLSKDQLQKDFRNIRKSRK